MTITKPKPKTSAQSTTQEAAAAGFIAGAPDSTTKPKGVRKGNKQQISLTMTPALLAKVDALAGKLGQSRAAVINMAVYRAVEHGLMIDGLGE
jgi:hypothetical protein